MPNEELFEGHEAKLARDREYDVDLTPTPVVEQYVSLFAAANKAAGLELHRILDPSAGEGVFGMVLRKYFPDAEIVGIEPRTETWARCHYDKFYYTNLEEVIRGVGKFDLIIGNPPFSEMPGWIPLLRDILAGSGDEFDPRTRESALVLLALSDLGQRSEEATVVFENNMPIVQYRIPGAIGYRGPGINPATGKKWGTDQRSYSWWGWNHPGIYMGGVRCRMENLPRLPGEDRRWKVPPGTEENWA